MIATYQLGFNKVDLDISKIEKLRSNLFTMIIKQFATKSIYSVEYKTEKDREIISVRINE